MDGRVDRRSFVVGGLALVGGAVLSACSGSPVTPSPRLLATPSPVAPTAGQRVVAATLRARPVTVDLGGPTVATWAYGDAVPGRLVRATAGDLLRIRVENALPAETTVHWHGIRLHNAADEVPGMTQEPIAPGAAFTYEFTAPDPGTYFFHPHVGVQLDRGLYAPLVVDDPAEPGDYDDEWVVVLDDWLDGTGRTPDQVLQGLRDAGATGSSGGMAGMGGMGGSGGMGGMRGGPFGDAGDVSYPYFLVNGRVPTAPTVFTSRPGRRVRLRVVNAASDTVFALALGGHVLTVTHTDGYAVTPTPTDAVYLGMGERYDVVVTLGDGVFPLVAAPVGKPGQAMALVRTASGSAPAAAARPAELDRSVLLGSMLVPAAAALLPARTPDATADLVLSGSSAPYVWRMNGAPYGENDPLTVAAGQRLRIRAANHTMMTHPLHVHGHTFALARSGLRKDTVLMRPMESIDIDVEADNPGHWMVHCHNAYHGEAGMMIALEYV